MATASKPPISPGIGEGRLERRERLHVGRRAHVLVAVEHASGRCWSFTGTTDRLK